MHTHKHKNSMGGCARRAKKEHVSTRRNTCQKAAFSAINATWAGLRTNPEFRRESPIIKACD
jgi:hypothetical protein